MQNRIEWREKRRFFSYLISVPIGIHVCTYILVYMEWKKRQTCRSMRMAAATAVSVAARGAIGPVPKPNAAKK